MPAPTAAPARQGMARSARLGWGAVLVIVIGVAGLLTYALTKSSPRANISHPTTTSADVLAALDIPPATFDAVGAGSSSLQLSPPVVLAGQPTLTSGGRPEVLFVGAEYCPFCAAERWSLVVALSRFGRFSTLHNVQSGGLSAYPSIQTFTFMHSSYSSPYLTFVGVELYSNVVNARGAFTRLSTLSPSQAALVAHFGGGPGQLPFVDIANHLVATTSAFSPAILVGESQATIAAALSQPTLTTGEAIVASANELVAGLCQVTHGQPSSVCASRATRAAGAALGLG